MLVDNLMQALNKDGHTQGMDILEEIKQNSQAFEAELRRFISLCDGFTVYSFVEKRLTQQVTVV